MRIRDFAAASRKAARKDALLVLGWQVAIFAGFLGLWEGLTRVPWFVSNTFLDPFFISRPSLVAQRIYEWTLGSQAGFIWPHLASTVLATAIGLVVSVVTGFVAGLGLSQSPRLARVLAPFITGANSLPRIAFVPLITMIFGLGLVSKVVTAWFIVFFLVFFNTFKGGQSIEPHVINFCRTLGASRSNLLWNVRIPFVLGWMFAALPNAVAFSLIGVVISEFVGSDKGMGYLIITSLSTLNATDMFATITILSALGIVLVSAIRHVEGRMMKWSPEFRDAH
ncbi:ABC transporter permease [Variovorax sp. 770b2]|uniref:ABC transporter permease n=1 Tax=Variovorax sp. 770b2 TaxID=1566271 RepID=UPI0008E7CA1A|nr:NitT/TauT family transport system permease protein [Variovorax sp. 770b2]